MHPEENVGQHGKKINMAIQWELRQYMRRQAAKLGSFTQDECGKELDVSGATISKYMSADNERRLYVGDSEGLESRIEALLANEKLRLDVSTEIFETPITRAVIGTHETVAAACKFGLITSPAGLGKSSGNKLYLRRNKTATLIDASRGDRSASDMECLVAAQLVIRKSHKTGRLPRRWDVIKKRFTNARRLIIVDEFHRLTRSGLQWWFDFHKHTGNPVCGVGNEEVLDVLRQEDQMFSQVAVHRRITIDDFGDENGRHKREQLRATVEQIVRAHVDEPCETLINLGITVAENEGHFRALANRLILAKVIKSKRNNDWPSAFKMAHQLSVNNQYTLEAA